ncbi:hypothetical protein RN001_000771 [Aquatica leii]|uniref:Uncharacterized protein n=1 Tax=Aquatica leii TaxID=1421715 RepID=A0AAN7PAI3_9COLE|nr:hypothetical protein RN001_000771 [Aquatica leii]
MIFKIILFYSLCIFITHAEIMSEIANAFRDQLVLKKAECDKKFKVGPYSVEAAIQDGVTDNSLNCFFDCVVQPDVISDEGKLKPDIFYKIIDSKYHHLVDSTQLPKDYRHHESAEVVESKPDPVVDLEVKEGKNHNNVMQKQTQPMDIELLDSSVPVPSLRRSKRTPKPIDKDKSGKLFRKYTATMN